MRNPVMWTALTIIILTGCGTKKELARKKFFRMDTITEATLVVPNRKIAEKCWNSIDSLLSDWEQRFSVESKNSEVRKLNKRESAIVPVDAQLKEMLITALNYGDSLNGGFDITVLPLKEAWGFAENSSPDSPLPTPEQVAGARKRVDYRNVKVVNDSVQFLSSQTKIDVGGIAKGFVLREIGKILKIYEVDDYLVSAGGDIIVKGKRIDGGSWRVGIQHPRNEGVVGIVSIDSGVVVTSGDYERFRIIDGKRYHHLFDISTGYCSSKNQSVTIWAQDPVEADVLSTGLFGRSAEEIIQYVNQRSKLECLVVDSIGTVFKSSGWEGKVKNPAK